MNDIEFLDVPVPPTMKVNLTEKEVLMIGEKFYNAIKNGTIHVMELSAITYTCMNTYLKIKDK